jgi:hypothetical protein
MFITVSKYRGMKNDLAQLKQYVCSIFTLIPKTQIYLLNSSTSLKATETKDCLAIYPIFSFRKPK